MNSTTTNASEAPRILAILTVRNEGAFLIDWLAHHRAIGFTDVLVLSNDCDDGTDAMLDRLQDLHWLTHLPNPGPHEKGPQWEALKRADSHPLKRAADWILFLDIDEYVNIHVGDHSVQALLAALPDATAIALTWRLFGNAGIRDFEDRPISEQFTRAAPAVMGWPWRAAMFKTLFRNDGSYGKLGVHRPRQPDRDRMPDQRWFDGSGRELPAPFRIGRIFSPYGRDNYRLVQLNHYALGAMESYVLKRDRGRANRDASVSGLSYWVERNLCTDDDQSIAAVASRSAELRAALHADHMLGALHKAAVIWRRDRFAQLMQGEEARSLFGRLMMTPPSRILSVDEHHYLTRFADPAALSRTKETDGSPPDD